MDEISVRILDTLFDLCEGESYLILEKEDFTSRISFYEFAPDELTEILEALSVNGFIDLKYADNREFCVAMKTKGRALIKQARERMQRYAEEHPAADEEGFEAREPHQDAPAEPASDGEKKEEKRSRPRSRARLSRESVLSYIEDGSGEDYLSQIDLTKGYAVHPSRESDGKDKADPKKSFLFALIGAAAGSLAINLIFLIIFLILFVKKG